MEEQGDAIVNGWNETWGTVNEWVIDFYRILPNLGAGLLIFILFLIVAFLAKASTRKYFNLRDRIDLGHILSGLNFWLFTLLGLGIAITIIMPSVKPGNLVAGMGIGSVAVGFVFKEILQNWFAGLLILLRLPFRRGDQITVGDAEGTVIRIDPRATILRTYDNRDIVVPNNTVYQSNVVVHTSQEFRRVELDLTVGYNYKIRTITKIIQNSLDQVDEILPEPPPQVLCWELGSTSLGIKVRWWIKSERSQENISRARAVQAIKEAFDANNIDPTDPQLVYYHEADEEDEVLAEEGGAGAAADSLTTLQSEETVAAGPPPPLFDMGTDDPETENPKLDSKAETILPQ
jgi:small-conductance mechanosensitive channel